MGLEIQISKIRGIRCPPPTQLSFLFFLVLTQHAGRRDEEHGPRFSLYGALMGKKKADTVLWEGHGLVVWIQALLAPAA